MATTVLLDTSIFIEYFRKQNKAKSAYYLLSNTYNLSASIITIFELGIGVRDARHKADIDAVMLATTVIPLNEQCIEQAIDLHVYLLRRNKIIGLADTLIAATALANNLALATLNRKHFERVPNLLFAELP